MQWYHLTIIAIAAVAFLASRGTPRASLWIVAVVAAYLGPVLYLNIPRPEWLPWAPPVSGVSFLFDGFVYFLITHKHEEAWEKHGLGTIFMISATIDMLQCFGVLTGHPPPLSTTMYGSILEIMNVLALLLIGGIGIGDMIRDGGFDISRSYRRYLGSVMHVAHAKTHASKPFRKVM